MGEPAMLQLFLKEEAWLAVATAIGLMATIGVIVTGRRQHISPKAITTTALNAFFGLWIGIMGTGHLFAVTTKTILGTLPSNIHLWVAIPFGFALAVPGWWLTARVKPLMKEDHAARKQAVWLNTWLAVVLIIPAWQLVIPPVLNLLMLARKSKVTPLPS